MAQVIYENDPIYRPENRAELEEIIRQGQEASRLLQQRFNNMLDEQDDPEEIYDWETPGS